jgi:acyl carrier protein
MERADGQGVRHELIAFLQTIVRPGFDMAQVADDTNLMDEGALDSLAVVLVIQHLESSYKIRFGNATIDPTRLMSVEDILGVILAGGE